MVFVHNSIAHLCSEVVSAAVATGMGNTLGNKGGVGISFFVGNTKILIVNSHLAAHDKAVKQRNADYLKINNDLPPLLDRKQEAQLAKSGSGIISTTRSGIVKKRPLAMLGHDLLKLPRYADRTIYMGDLNYRIRGNR